MCNDTTVSKFKNDFHYTLSKFSHELRNPLTLINSGLQMIASAHPEVKEYEHWDDVMDNLDYVKEQLENNNTYQKIYSIMDENNNIKMKRAFYTYLNKHKDTIVCTIMEVGK